MNLSILQTSVWKLDFTFSKFLQSGPERGKKVSTPQSNKWYLHTRYIHDHVEEWERLWQANCRHPHPFPFFQFGKWGMPLTHWPQTCVVSWEKSGHSSSIAHYWCDHFRVHHGCLSLPQVLKIQWMDNLPEVPQLFAQKPCFQSWHTGDSTSCNYCNKTRNLHGLIPGAMWREERNLEPKYGVPLNTWQLRKYHFETPSYRVMTSWIPDELCLRLGSVGCMKDESIPSRMIQADYVQITRAHGNGNSSHQMAVIWSYIPGWPHVHIQWTWCHSELSTSLSIQ